MAVRRLRPAYFNDSTRPELPSREFVKPRSGSEEECLAAEFVRIQGTQNSTFHPEPGLGGGNRNEGFTTDPTLCKAGNQEFPDPDLN